MLLDDLLIIRYLNVAAEGLLSSSRRYLLSRALASCWQDDGGIMTVLRDCLKNGHPIEGREVSVRLLSGATKTIDYSITRIEEPDRAYLVLLEMRSVGHLLRLSREEGRAQAQRAVSQLVRGLAHEIRNPLGGIRGAAQLMAAALPETQWQEYLEVIIAESDRLRVLTERMLGMRQVSGRRRINIHVCLERARKLVRSECPDLEIACDYDPSLPTLWADRDQLVQVFLNLIRNAMQVLVENAVPDARVVLRSRVERQRTLQGRLHRLVLRVDVIDNGPGVPEALQDALFFPMVTGRCNGLGLGLPLAQESVRQHGGLIDCNSRPGRTCFSVLLPVTEAVPSFWEQRNHGG